MKITCEIIQDLLPLYYDNVCSEDSRKLVEDHFKTCKNCRHELELMSADIYVENQIEDINVIKNISKHWKNDKLIAFLIGVMVISALSCMGCIVAYQLIGSYVASDGTLVEPFALIPLSFLSAFVTLLSIIFLGILRLVKRKRLSKI
ncbi:DUF3955 domain-containing protein [Anaerotignum sp.]|uniref:DUF3955 domain-containing protein n=1 Tax=Anaerotignum sp. TaxID=2039241 RepID=UPI003330B11C